MRRAERTTVGTRMPLMLDTDNTTRDEHLDETLLDRFVAVQLRMVSRTSHNKEKGQYLGTKSNGIEESTASRELLHTST